MVMGTRLALSDIDRQGITHLTQEDILSAKRQGKRWKLIGTLEYIDGKIKASVRPTALPIEHPLANVNGVLNAVTYTTDLLGEVTLIGTGAGRTQTGYALLNDLLVIHGRIE